MGRLPTEADFPSTVKLTIVPPPQDDPPTNVLILLHGLGDSRQSFAALGKQMNLPETACISIEGSSKLLDLDGSHWGDDIIFDSSNGGLDPDAGFKQSTKILRNVVLEVLVGECGYKTRELMFFGFGQGAMAALDVAVDIHQSNKDSTNSELGGVICIGAALPNEAPAALNPKSKTPVLVCAGSSNSSVTPSSEDKLQHVFEFVDLKRYRRPGDSMPSNRDEMLPIMQFFSRRLRSTKGVPKGSVEVG